MEEQYWKERGKGYSGQHNSTMPTIGLVLGIIAICAACIPIVNVAALIMGILATVFGVVGICKKMELGKSVAALVLGFFAVILVVMMYAGLAFFIHWGIEQSEESAKPDLPSAEESDQTAVVLATMLDVTFGTFNVEEVPFNEPESALVVRVTNKTDRVQSFDITVSAYDVSGHVVATATFYADDLVPWQSQQFVIFDSVDAEDIPKLKAASFRVTKAAVFEN